MEKKLDKNAEKITLLKQENETLKQKIKEQDKILEVVEKEIKKNNLIIQKVADQEREDQLDPRKEFGYNSM